MQLDCLIAALAAQPRSGATQAEALGLTPREHGEAGGADALKHATDHAPAFVLKALGNALLGFRGFDFTAEDVRLRAEQSEAVKGWLAVKGREAFYGGWFMTHAKLHRLVAIGTLKRSERKEARGRKLPVWRFPG